MKSPTIKYPNHRCHIILTCGTLTNQQVQTGKKKDKALSERPGCLRRNASWNRRLKRCRSDRSNRERANEGGSLETIKPQLFHSKLPLWSLYSGFFNHFTVMNLSAGWWWNIPWHCRVCNAWPVPPGCASMIYLKRHEQKWLNLRQKQVDARGVNITQQRAERTNKNNEKHRAFFPAHPYFISLFYLFPPIHHPSTAYETQRWPKKTAVKQQTASYERCKHCTV